MSQKKKRQHATATLQCYDKDGHLKWEEYIPENTAHDECENFINSACFATGYANYGATPANLYLGLDARSSVAETDTLASLVGENALGSYGYSRQALSTAGTGLAGQDFVLDATAGTATTKSVTWTCSVQAWTAVTKIFLCTHATATTSGSGTRLLVTLSLTASRTLQVGDSLSASLVVTVSE